MGCWCGEEGVWARVVKLVTEEGKGGVMTAGFCPAHRWLFALPEIRSRSWVGVDSMRTGFADPRRPSHEAPVLARPVLVPAKLSRASFGQFTPSVQVAPAQRPALLSTAVPSVFPALTLIPQEFWLHEDRPLGSLPHHQPLKRRSKCWLSE